MQHYIAVKDLPACLRTALQSVGYGRADVRVEAATTVNVGDPGGTGVRAGVMAVNLATGEASRVVWGSWGGPNMFNPHNPVDDMDRTEPVHPNGAVIRVREGGGRPVSATVYVRPETLTPMLPAGPEVTDRERWILSVYAGLKSFARREYLDRAKVADSELDSLVERGYLKRARNGATQITTAGKNARAGADPYMRELWQRDREAVE